MRELSPNAVMIKLITFICFSLILSVSVAIMPLSVSLEGKTFIPVYITGVMFWLGLIGTIVSIVSINYSRKKSQCFKKDYPDLKRFGLVAFFNNRTAKIADVTMIASLVLFVIFKVFCDNLSFLKFITLAVFLFAFILHCFFNGINFIYIKYMVRRGIEQ